MKVLLVNGSAREHGCTDAALTEVARALNEEGVVTEFVFIGNQPLPDCIGCRKCREMALYSAHQSILRIQVHACLHLWIGRSTQAATRSHSSLLPRY